MNETRELTILLSPHVSEKATVAEAFRQYVFKVMVDAKKLEIKKAVESLFSVEVASVRTVNVKGKKTRFKRVEGRRKGWKKAYVTLKEGHVINLGGNP